MAIVLKDVIVSKVDMFVLKEFFMFARIIHAMPTILISDRRPTHKAT